MYKLMLTPQAAADIANIGEFEAGFVRKSLEKLQSAPGLGLKLWGRDDILLYQTMTDARIVYRVSATEIQVLGVNSLQVPVPVIDSHPPYIRPGAGCGAHSLCGYDAVLFPGRYLSCIRRRRPDYRGRRPRRIGPRRAQPQECDYRGEQ